MNQIPQYPPTFYLYPINEQCANRAGCDHEPCQRIRAISKSACHYCRAVIGTGVMVADLRTDIQRDRDLLIAGFAHTRCHRKFYNRFYGKQPRQHVTNPLPGRPAFIHIPYDDDTPPLRRRAISARKLKR